MKTKLTKEEIELITKCKFICRDTVKFDAACFSDGVERELEFDIYDGFAYCEDYCGNDYCLTYPTLSFIKGCKEMLQAVRDFMGLNENDDITVMDIIQSYSTLQAMDKTVCNGFDFIVNVGDGNTTTEEEEDILARSMANE